VADGGAERGKGADPSAALNGPLDASGRGGRNHGRVTTSPRGELFGGLFDRGTAGTGDIDWLQAMLDTEAALARALERAGCAPAGAGAAVTAQATAGNIDLAEIGRQAALTGNPVPALVRSLSGLVPPDARAAVHRGATSQDIIDTALMLLARRGLDGIDADLDAAAAAAARLAEQHAGTVMAGRTLLQQAVPVTFGLVAAGWLTAVDDARRELSRIRANGLAVQFGGAAGTLASLGDNGAAVGSLLAGELGLPEPVLPWHTDRSRLIRLASALTQACAALGKIARDVTLLAQTEVGEVAEGAGEPGRGGSSAMPHKRNPVASLVILGCTRRAPGLLATVAANAEHELQRAAGAWHAEWETMADLLRLTASAAAWAAELLAGLSVDADRMRENLNATGGLPMAEHVAAVLAPALGQLEAHDLVRDASARAARLHISLHAALLDDPTVARAGIGSDDLTAALDPAGYLGTAAEFVRRALAAHRAGDNNSGSSSD
jgi:3-carboxy-cis,cis-muconate cycloisomerase